MKIKSVLLIALFFCICQDNSLEGGSCPQIKLPQINLPQYNVRLVTAAQRQKILDNMRKKTEIVDAGSLIARSKHFEVRITGLSMNDLALEKNKKLEDLLFKVLYILEEAYDKVGKDFNYFPSGRIAFAELYSRRRYNLEEMGRESGGQAVSTLDIKIPLDGESAFDPLSSRLVNVLYHEYTHVVLFAIRPSITGNTVIHETLAKFEATKALFVSSWINDFNEEEISQLVSEFNRLNKDIIKKYKIK